MATRPISFWSESERATLKFIGKPRRSQRYLEGRVARKVSPFLPHFAQPAERTLRAGDRVAIVARNLPEYISFYWAIHLLGAVAVCCNAWLPEAPLTFCLTNTNSKFILADEERAIRLQPSMDKLRQAGLQKLLVTRAAKALPGTEDFRRWLAKGAQHTTPPAETVEPEDLVRGNLLPFNRY